MHVKNLKKCYNKYELNFYSSMTDPIALAVTFPGNLEKKFLKYLGSILDIIFFKISYFIFEIRYRRWILAFAVASHKNLEVHIF